MLTVKDEVFNREHFNINPFNVLGLFDLNDIEPTMVNYTIFNVVKARYRLLSELFHTEYERPNYAVYNEVIKAQTSV
uniref:Uncharacterized protein n=1 Tax=Acrobeloides nanus TaxID=290746 RepID=A0A914EBL7_9BILA